MEMVIKIKATFQKKKKNLYFLFLVKRKEQKRKKESIKFGNRIRNEKM